MARKTSYILLSVAIIAFSVSCAPAAATTTWYDATVNVNALSYYAIYGAVTGGQTLTIQIQVTSGNDITLYILDQTNYNNYISSQSFYYYDHWPNYVSSTVTWQAPSTQTYYFVLDNKDSYTSTSVHLTITYGESGGLGAFDLSSLIPIIAIIAVVGLVAVAVILATRKHKAPAQ